MKTIIHKPNNKRKLKEYAAKLKKSGMLIEFGRYVFDADALFKTKYECDPVHCLRELKGRHFGSCCTDYIVYLTPKEINRLADVLQIGRDLCQKKYPQALNPNMLARTNKGEGYFKHTEKNICPLSVVENGRILCIVDKITEAYGLSRKKYKPSTCYSWPFECVQFGEKIFVTAINGKNGKCLSQATGELKCVSGKVGKVAALEMKEQLLEYLGVKTYNKLMKEAEKKGFINVK